MTSSKRILLIIAIAVIAIVDIIIYWNSHLYYRAKMIEDNEKKIEILEISNQFYTLNDLVFYELGKAYFDLGIRNINDKEKSNDYLRKSIQNFSRSVRINPASQFSHFNFAQSLYYMSFLSPSSDFNSYDEYKKAATLAGHNSQIFFEVGKIFLSRWSELSDEDRDFTVRILRKLVGGKNREVLQTLMHTWEMNVKDYEVMKKILPEDPQIYMIYAKFMGEKSLSLDERQRILAEAEFMEFEKAKSLYNSGEGELLYYGVKEAFNHFRSALDILEKIKFYQNLTQQNLIDQSEFNMIQKSTFLNLAKCRIEEGRELKEVEGHLRKYLTFEDRVAAMSELESYLRDRGLIGEKLDTNFDDLAHLSFQLLLYFKQNRYRDIEKIGRILQKSVIVVPDAKREGYVRVLQLVGDAFQKVDYIYDAGEFFQKAYEIDQENLETLLRIRRNYERLNDNRKIREIQKRIDILLSPVEIVFENLTINKGRSFKNRLSIDGRKIVLNLFFKRNWKDITPLVTVFFNDRVVWEDYLKDEVLSLPLESRIGENSLEVAAVNREVSIDKLTYQ